MQRRFPVVLKPLATRDEFEPNYPNALTISEFYFMTNIPFKAGDVVRVKSGGPQMTVTQTGEAHMTGEPTVWCVWFDGTKKMDDTFAPDAL
jgi:uncharacterized protein YodC (DUF2158 family)